MYSYFNLTRPSCTFNLIYIYATRVRGYPDFVIEVNPRASRTVPFLSKITGVPMVKAATNVMLGKSLAEQGYESGLWPIQPLVGVKAPVFSMSKLFIKLLLTRRSAS